MQKRYHLYLRQHPNDWYTVSVLTHPAYAAFGPALPALREEIAAVLADELASGALDPDEDTWFEDLTRMALELELKAVQHDRLIRVPLRVSLVVRPLPELGTDHFEVRAPRLGQVFRIVGREDILPWAEELVRGEFHLEPVEALLPYQYARGERIETLEVTWHGGKAKRAKAKARREREDDDDLPRRGTPL
ncbi:MAG: hypothetical protein KC620_18350, partial [Myxococcales bacterium]|nr:hypothetical protein [Myxococcales bacterium]